MYYQDANSEVSLVVDFVASEREWLKGEAVYKINEMASDMFLVLRGTCAYVGIKASYDADYFATGFFLTTEKEFEVDGTPWWLMVRAMRCPILANRLRSLSELRVLIMSASPLVSSSLL